ncbi:alpha/beta hydrolase [Pedobacter glucosidilyticus]|uniref:alpha/beta hydrolase n=1 Tax=Pedobacter glucosidilyticus TaxID=1122941 RepID=UPI0026EBCBF0|nr:alpha/beta hydrolase fold domain-containing protein [Pedobacter glucosidilyticus]
MINKKQILLFICLFPFTSLVTAQNSFKTSDKKMMCTSNYNKSEVLIKQANKTDLRSFEGVIRKSFEIDLKTKKSFTYKNVEGKELQIFGFFPKKQLKKQSCVVFIHGGSWSGGNIQGSMKWCRYLAEQGTVAFTIEYRLSTDKPYKCLEDIKSGVRWIRKNALQFNIDTTKIALSGSSAGGHLAAATATINEFNSANDDLSISCKPQLLLLVSPVIDNGPDGFGYERVKDYWKEFSPLHNMNDNLPPTCILLGEKDPLIPVKTALKFAEAVKKSRSDIKFYVFKGEGHNIFDQSKSELADPIIQTYYYWQKFLAQHKYVTKPKKLKSGYKIPTEKYKI